ncbi:MAG: DNA translocase FtsK [Flavisolibacter sp.]|nr:DNA translocase FtsK [Flavisolibacter sp.]
MANKLKSNTPATAEKPVVKEKAEKAEKASKPKPVAKKKPAPQKFQNDKEEKVDLKKLAKDERTWKIIGTVSLLISIFLFIAFVSYLFTWDDDQSQVLNRGVAFLWDNDKESEVSNLLGRLGAYSSHNLIYNGFGLASFLFCTFFFVVGINLLFERKVFSIWRNLKYVTIGLLIVSISLSFLFSFANFPYGGKVGDMISQWMIGLVGTIGTAALLIVVVASYLIWQFNPSFNLPEKKPIPVAENNEEAEGAKLIVDTSLLNEKTVNDLYADEEKTAVSEKGNLLKGEGEMVLTINNEDANSEFTLTEKDEPEEEEEQEDDVSEELTADEPIVEKEIADDLLHKHDLPVEPVVQGPQPKKKEEPTPASDLELEIKTAEEEPEEENKEKDYSDLPPYEPTLDLRDYKYPKIDLLETYSNEKIVQDPAELEANKNQIINTLKNYDITIQKISATIGPTVTLYEIVPAAGVRISRIKNLEDDIALSLAALGIRIIAPIPGRGTIGIEVPNIKKTIVSMKGLLSSEKFTHSNYNLPIAIGKKIDNENFIVDLTTMPHLLMAGATGQGKSVGLNAILVSLLYKKHPSQLKFVLVDPKKVELSIYRHIEKHFLAKLPGEEDAIITDTKKVINTLNALCIEMDNRYDLLKEAGARNIKEYNEKFTKRRLNPQKGHQYLPFIVLVVDEFADLIMTAGKEVEMPIARLAQLARAVGIHLVIATQRPSVNIITGTIKANFPARIAFKVSSKIDSRTILDAGGAEQLIGKGDMLISYNGDITRLQCAFVDTPEVEKVVEFISDQRGYPQAFMLPEYVDEKELEGKDFDTSDKDPLFEDAARLIVQNQIGSTSLLQRRMKLGYNRAGRLMDQLEAAGVVGPNQGSKAREVLIKTEAELQEYLETLS